MLFEDAMEVTIIMEVKLIVLLLKIILEVKALDEELKEVGMGANHGKIMS